MSTRTKYKILAKDMGLFSISSFGTKLLFFFLTPLYTSYLTTNDYGIADLLTTTNSFIYPLLTLAIVDATLRYSLDKQYNKTNVFCISTVITLVSIVVLCLCRPLITLIDPSLDYYWSMFLVIYSLSNIFNYLVNFVKGLGRTKLFAVQGIVHTLTIIISNIIFLVVLKMGVDGYLFSFVIGYIVPILLLIVKAKLYKYITPFKIDKELLKDMLKYSIPLIPTMLLWSVNTTIDKYMIIHMYSMSDSGIYSIAHKIPSITSTVFSIFLSAWYISAITNHGSDDESNYYTNIYKTLDIVGLLGSMIIIILNKYLAGLLYAKDFYAAWKYVPFLLISSMFSSYAGFIASAYRASKKTKHLLFSVILGAILNVILNCFLLKYVGVIGAAIATAVSFFVVWLVRIISVQKIVKIGVAIVPTVISYSLLLLSVIISTVDIPYVMIYDLAIFVIIIIINIKTLRFYLNIMGSIFKKLFAGKRRT